jgi:hypothetical protein
MARFREDRAKGALLMAWFGWEELLTPGFAPPRGIPISVGTPSRTSNDLSVYVAPFLFPKSILAPRSGIV